MIIYGEEIIWLAQETYFGWTWVKLQRKISLAQVSLLCKAHSRMRSGMYSQKVPAQTLCGPTGRWNPGWLLTSTQTLPTQGDGATAREAAEEAALRRRGVPWHSFSVTGDWKLKILFYLLFTSAHNILFFILVFNEAPSFTLDPSSRASLYSNECAKSRHRHASCRIRSVGVT